MTQHDGVIANQGFSAFRADLNDLAQAILSTHSGTSAPSGVVAGQFWIDTDTPSATVRTLFHYDGADSIGIMQIDYTNNYIAKIGVGIVPSAMAVGTLLHVKNGASGVTADSAADDVVVEGSGTAVGQTISGPDTATLRFRFAFASDDVFAGLQADYPNNQFIVGTSHASTVLILQTGAGVEAARLDALRLLVGDTSDANVTQGVIVNQGSSDDNILTLKSSDIAHGGTSGYGETDTFFKIFKRNSTEGGAELGGAGEGECGIQIRGYESTNNATKSTAASGAVRLVASTLLGGNTVAMQSGNSNLVTISDNGTCRFIFDKDGDSHQDVGTAWTNFDTEDDSVLLTVHNQVMAQRSAGRNDLMPSPEFFGRLHHLSGKKLWGYVGPREWAKGIRPTMNYSAATRLLIGEAEQRANREAVYVEALEQMLPGFMDRCNELATGRNVGKLPAPINL